MRSAIRIAALGAVVVTASTCAALEDSSPRDTQHASADTAPSRSQGNGRVSIVVFADYQCPACRKFALNHWLPVKQRFGDRVQMVFRHWPQPYHPFAYRMAIASDCAADQGRFQEFHDLVFLKQDSIPFKPALSFAEDAGVASIKDFEKCAAKGEPQPNIERDIAEAVRIGGRGTPTLVIDGVTHRLRTDPRWLMYVIDSLVKRSW